MKITFWQNMPSHHMAPVQRALADLPRTKVRVIFAGGISNARLDLGWSVPDLGRAETQTVYGDVEMLTKFAKSSDGVNLIGGLGGQFTKCILKNLPHNENDLLGLLLERGIFVGGLKDRLRPLYHRVRLHSIRKKFDLIFAFGSLGVEYYADLGVPETKIFPFLYQSNSTNFTVPSSTSLPVRLIYVGGLTHRKGADLLPEALARLNEYDWNLKIVGGGALKSQMRQRFDQYGLNDRIRWLGEIASERVAVMLGESDLCIVPSRHDGWGMAVNEAIEAGLCVVATSRVGAKDLITSSKIGTIAHDATADLLAEALQPYLNNPQAITLAKCEAVRVREHFRGKAVAKYTVAVLRHLQGKSSAPPAPWEQAAIKS